MVPQSFEKAKEAPKEQIRRILLNIQIAHTLLGARKAFERLFYFKAIEQAEHYAKGQEGGLSHVELNRLRTLALAVVGLTRYEAITDTEEDRKYFELFSASSDMDDMQEIITARSSVLFEVQQAEADVEQMRRDLALQGVVLILAAFTLISVLADSYNFLGAPTRQQDQLIVDFVMRELVLVSLAVLLVIVAATFFRTLVMRGSRRRG